LSAGDIWNDEIAGIICVIIMSNLASESKTRDSGIAGWDISLVIENKRTRSDTFYLSICWNSSGEDRWKKEYRTSSRSVGYSKFEVVISFDVSILP
jgi:hypothetical protein